MQTVYSCQDMQFSKQALHMVECKGNGEWIGIQRRQLSNLFSVSLLKKNTHTQRTLKGNNSLPLGSNSFLVLLDTLPEGDWCRGKEIPRQPLSFVNNDRKSIP